MWPWLEQAGFPVWDLALCLCQTIVFHIRPVTQEAHVTLSFVWIISLSCLYYNFIISRRFTQPKTGNINKLISYLFYVTKIMWHSLCHIDYVWFKQVPSFILKSVGNLFSLTILSFFWIPHFFTPFRNNLVWFWLKPRHLGAFWFSLSSNGLPSE